MKKLRHVLFIFIAILSFGSMASAVTFDWDGYFASNAHTELLNDGVIWGRLASPDGNGTSLLDSYVYNVDTKTFLKVDFQNEKLAYPLSPYVVYASGQGAACSDILYTSAQITGDDFVIFNNKVYQSTTETTLNGDITGFFKFSPCTTYNTTANNMTVYLLEEMNPVPFAYPFGVLTFNNVPAPGSAGDTNATIAALTAQVDALNTQVGSLAAQIAGVNTAIAQNTTAIADINTGMGELQTAILDAITQLQDDLTVEIDAKIAPLATDITNLSTRITVLENAPKNSNKPLLADDQGSSNLGSKVVQEVIIKPYNKVNDAIKRIFRKWGW